MLSFPRATCEGFSFSRSTAGVKMFVPVASRGVPHSSRTAAAQQPYNRMYSVKCDLSGWGGAELVPESDSVGFSFSRSTAGVKMYDPVCSRRPADVPPYNRYRRGNLP